MDWPASPPIPFKPKQSGAAILMMIAYHLLYDGVVFAGWDIPLFSPPLSLWQDSIGALFILLSGCMCRLSRSNWRRGLRCLAAALAITAVTFFLVPTVADWFGVLHFLGCAMLLYPLFRPLLDRFPALPGAVCCFLLFWATYPVSLGKIGGLFWQANLPSFLYRNFLTAILGFPPHNFVSSDYYPLLPWIFLPAAGLFGAAQLCDLPGPPAGAVWAFSSRRTMNHPIVKNAKAPLFSAFWQLLDWKYEKIANFSPFAFFSLPNSI